MWEELLHIDKNVFIYLNNLGTPSWDGFWMFSALWGAATALVGEEVHYVQFRFEAPDATSVQVGGDFSGWEPEVDLVDLDGDGEWSGRLRLPPGVHKYMFLVNGETWYTDPHAERYVEDGFGNQNAVKPLPCLGHPGRFRPARTREC